MSVQVLEHLECLKSWMGLANWEEGDAEEEDDIVDDWNAPISWGGLWDFAIFYSHSLYWLHSNWSGGGGWILK
jgi:hypothetical protein